MSTQRVEFDAHKKSKQPVKVVFETKNGEKVKFVAKKIVKVPVHVRFRAKE